MDKGSPYGKMQKCPRFARFHFLTSNLQMLRLSRVIYNELYYLTSVRHNYFICVQNMTYPFASFCAFSIKNICWVVAQSSKWCHLVIRSLHPEVFFNAIKLFRTRWLANLFVKINLGGFHKEITNAHRICSKTLS